MVVVQEERARARVGVLYSPLFVSNLHVLHLGIHNRTIRLPSSDHHPRTLGGFHGSGSDVLDTIASVPWFLLGLASIAYEYVASNVEGLLAGVRPRRGYRDVPVDEDAQILRFEDEEE